MIKMGKLFACRQTKCIPENPEKLVYNSFLGQCTIQADKLQGLPTEHKLVEKENKEHLIYTGMGRRALPKINAR